MQWSSAIILAVGIVAAAAWGVTEATRIIWSKSEHRKASPTPSRPVPDPSEGEP